MWVYRITRRIRLALCSIYLECLRGFSLWSALSVLTHWASQNSWNADITWTIPWFKMCFSCMGFTCLLALRFFPLKFIIRFCFQISDLVGSGWGTGNWCPPGFVGRVAAYAGWLVGWESVVPQPCGVCIGLKRRPETDLNHGHIWFSSCGRSSS